MRPSAAAASAAEPEWWPGEHSTLEPSGAGAEAVADLWWWMFGVSTLATLAVLVLLAVALRRQRAAGEAEARSVGWKLLLGGGVALPLVSIVALVVASVVVDRAGADASDAPVADVEVEVTARQWFWDVTHETTGGATVTGANELHIPVGERVLVRLRSDDVIHSFWVPSLAGKVDAVPGRENELWLHASEGGTYRGLCAELCGAQHAKMQFIVVAEERADFDRWIDERREPAAATSAAAAAGEQHPEGQQVFVRNCAACHTVAGTPARGVRGPDLTHVGSRLTLAAGTLPNSTAHMAAWITSPQEIKPGSRMPSQPVPADDVDVLVDYLEALE